MRSREFVSMYLQSAVARTRSRALRSVSRVRTSQLLQLLLVRVRSYECIITARRTPKTGLRLLSRRGCCSLDFEIDTHTCLIVIIAVRLRRVNLFKLSPCTVLYWRSDIGDWASNAHFTPPSLSNRSIQSEGVGIARVNAVSDPFLFWYLQW
jgi:hypothetical protein